MSDDIDNKRWQQASRMQTAIFLWQGFMDVAVPGGNYDAVPDKSIYDSHFDGLGNDGGALSVGYVADVLEDEYAKWASHDFPGVYHYEITEPLGAWWAKEGPKLHEFQYGEAQRIAALKIIVDRYNELMAEWLVTEKLTSKN